MDPIGFALENFDWFGRWRWKAMVTPSMQKGACQGTRFEGPIGLRNVIIYESSMISFPNHSKMLSHALGRQLEYFDEPAVRTILRVFNRKVIACTH